MPAQGKVPLEPAGDFHQFFTALGSQTFGFMELLTRPISCCETPFIYLLRLVFTTELFYFHVVTESYRRLDKDCNTQTNVKLNSRPDICNGALKHHHGAFNLSLLFLFLSVTLGRWKCAKSG